MAANKQKIGKAKRQWRDENAKRFHDMDKWIKNCKPLKKPVYDKKDKTNKGEEENK